MRYQNLTIDRLSDSPNNQAKNAEGEYAFKLKPIIIYFVILKNYQRSCRVKRNYVLLISFQSSTKVTVLPTDRGTEKETTAPPGNRYLLISPWGT